MTKIDQGALAFDWKRAYTAANPENSLPNIIYRRGWFYIDRRPYRRSELIAMTERLWKRAAEKNG